MAAPRRSARSHAQQVRKAVRAIAVSSRLLEQSCRRAGLSLPQYRMLLLVKRGPSRAAELAVLAAVRRPTLTALVDGLEKQGLLSRSPVDGDRRGVRLELTSDGHEALAVAEDVLADALDRLSKRGDQPAILAGLDELGDVVEDELRELAASYPRV